jgi:hypothetical protein
MTPADRPATAATNRQPQSLVASFFGWLRRRRRNHAATIVLSSPRNHAATGLKPSSNHVQPRLQNDPRNRATISLREQRKDCVLLARARIALAGPTALRAFGRLVSQSLAASGEIVSILVEIADKGGRPRP